MNTRSTVSPIRRQPSTGTARCIVVESGAAALTPTSDGFDETVVVTQTVGELPMAFALRVLARVAGVERSCRHFESLTLLVGSRSDRASLETRRLVVLGLAAHARAHEGSSELLLEVSSGIGPEQRAELLGVIEEVLAASTGRPFPVRLIFGAEPPHRSGIFPAVTQLRELQV